MVEHLLAKEKAAGSNPVFRSISPDTHLCFARFAAFPLARQTSLDVGHDSLCRVRCDSTLLVSERLVTCHPS